jgi:hypothetical protein
VASPRADRDMQKEVELIGDPDHVEPDLFGPHRELTESRPSEESRVQDSSIGSPKPISSERTDSYC